jgi:lipopolysaccharide O-acetyltransferase
VLLKAANFLKINGLYVFSSELLRRSSTMLRSRMIGRKLKTKGLQIGPRSFVRGLAFMQIGNNFHAADGLWIEAISAFYDQSFSPRIVIGNNVTISRWTHIAATNYVEIGENTLIGSKVIITDHNHGQYKGLHSSPEISPELRPLDRDKDVVIGRNVWLGDGVVVAPGSKIGDGSIIGGNSVVHGTIPAYHIAAGAPARVLKRYNFELQNWIRIE